MRVKKELSNNVLPITVKRPLPKKSGKTVKKLSDEEFADYKEHLVETKAEIEAAVKATADPKPTEPSTTANEPTEPVEPEDTSANTEHANKPNARELAAITSEVRLSDETKSKYASLFSEDE